jgi:hypothetical protein
VCGVAHLRRWRLIVNRTQFDLRPWLKAMTLLYEKALYVQHTISPENCPYLNNASWVAAFFVVSRAWDVRCAKAARWATQALPQSKDATRVAVDSSTRDF